jgi:hypothetical protein
MKGANLVFIKDEEEQNKAKFSIGLNPDRFPFINKIESWVNQDRHDISDADFQDLKEYQKALDNPDTIKSFKDYGYSDEDISKLREQISNDIKTLNLPDVKGNTEVNIPIKAEYNINPDTKLTAAVDLGVGGKNAVNVGGSEKAFNLGFSHKFGRAAKAVKDAVSNAKEAISQGSNEGSAFGRQVSEVLGNIGEGARNYGRNLGTFGGKVGGATKKLAGAAATSFLGEQAKAFGEGARNFGYDILEDAKVLPPRFLEGINQIGKNLYNAGSTVGAGLAKGKESLSKMISDMYNDWYSPRHKPIDSKYLKSLSVSPPILPVDKSQPRAYRARKDQNSNYSLHDQMILEKDMRDFAASHPEIANEIPANNPVKPNLHDQRILEKDYQDVLRAIDPMVNISKRYNARKSVPTDQNSNGSNWANHLDQTKLEFINMVLNELNKKNSLKSWYNRAGWRDNHIQHMMNRNYNRNFMGRI